jgi:hypothetical protein
MPIVTVHPSGEVVYLAPDEAVLSGLYKAGMPTPLGAGAVAALCARWIA